MLSEVLIQNGIFCLKNVCGARPYAISKLALCYGGLLPIANNSILLISKFWNAKETKLSIEVSEAKSRSCEAFRED